MASKSNFLTKKYGQDLELLLRKLYVDERKTMREIGDSLGVDAAAIYYHLNKFKIQTRNRYDHPVSDKVRANASQLGKGMKGTKKSAESRNKISLSRKGYILKPSQYGGHIKDRNGYSYVYIPEHPYASSDGYVMEHRLVMESCIGRYLEKDEVIHHINGNKKDNRIENLMIMTPAEHLRLHNQKRRGEII